VKIVETVLLRALSSSSECLLRLYATEFKREGLHLFLTFLVSTLCLMSVTD
jgi:hypothetical protein